MGSGKTTLGKKVATKLNVPFFDLDNEIEKELGLSIDEIFSTKGEDYFRERERETLTRIIAVNDGFVLSLGGGTPCFYDNIDIINQSGLSIYLKYNSGILASRLLNAKKERPLIKEFGEAELEKYIVEKLKEREPYYIKSKKTLEGNNLKTDDLIALIQ